MKMANLKNQAILVLVCALLLFLAVDASCKTRRNYNNSIVKKRFKTWLQHHNKHYKGKEEWMLRFGIYQANLDFINFVNSQNLSYKLGDNEFADLTNAEFKELYVGRVIVPHPSDYSHNFTESTTNMAVPASVDWRTKGAVSDVKSQGTCGSCWAFSAAAGVEAVTQIKTGKLVSLSAQELLDCVADSSCKGGYRNSAFDYIKSNGIAKFADYPYTGSKATCKTTAAKAAKISGYKAVTKNSEAALMQAVAQQPVGVLVECSGHDFQLYASGIFAGNCGTKVDHDLPVVGYGAEGGCKYWLLKNSWGTDWGENGYMRLLREGGTAEGTCGVAMFASFPVA